MKMITSRRPRNPIAKAVRTPLYKMRVVENKRKKLLKKWSKALLKDGSQPLAERWKSGKRW